MATATATATAGVSGAWNERKGIDCFGQRRERKKEKKKTMRERREDKEEEEEEEEEENELASQSDVFRCWRGFTRELTGCAR